MENAPLLASFPFIAPSPHPAQLAQLWSKEFRLTTRWYWNCMPPDMILVPQAPRAKYIVCLLTEKGSNKLLQDLDSPLEMSNPLPWSSLAGPSTKEKINRSLTSIIYVHI